MYFECDEEDLKPDCSSGHWILQSYWDPSYILQTNILDFPMGTHEWESKEDFALCNKFSGYHIATNRAPRCVAARNTPALVWSAPAHLC